MYWSPPDFPSVSVLLLLFYCQDNRAVRNCLFWLGKDLPGKRKKSLCCWPNFLGLYIPQGTNSFFFFFFMFSTHQFNAFTVLNLDHLIAIKVRKIRDVWHKANNSMQTLHSFYKVCFSIEDQKKLNRPSKRQDTGPAHTNDIKQQHKSTLRVSHLPLLSQ